MRALSDSSSLPSVFPSSDTSKLTLFSFEKLSWSSAHFIISELDRVASGTDALSKHPEISSPFSLFLPTRFPNSFISLDDVLVLFLPSNDSMGDAGIT